MLSSAVVGTTTYYVTQNNNYSCESTPASISYTVNALPDAPTLNPNSVFYCQGTSAPNLPTSLNGNTLTWYSTQTGNTPLTSLTVQTTDAKVTTYYASQTDANKCESTRSTFTVRVGSRPALPQVTIPAPYCQGTKAASLSATALTGNTLNWYAEATDSTPLTNLTPQTTEAKTTIYYVSQTDGSGCESDRAPISVTVKRTPDRPGTTPISYCINNVMPLTATFESGSLPKWYGTDPTSQPTSTAPTPLTTVTGAPITYYVSQSVNGCESEKASLAVTINALPTQPRVSANPVYYCLGATASPLSATADSGGSLRWYRSLTDPTPLPDPPTPLTTSSTPPTTNYYVSQVVSGCEGARSSIAVTINPIPDKPTVVAPRTYCQNDSPVALSATASGSNTLTWYDQNGVIIPPPAPTPSAATPGTTSYSVSQSANGCESERATTTVTIVAKPDAPASATVALCLTSTPTALTATAPNGGSLKWYTANGVALVSAPVPPTNALNTFTYYVSQIVNGCEGPRGTITVIVQPLPAVPTVSSVSLCQNSTPAALTAVAPNGGSLKWYTANGVALPEAPSPPTNVPNTFTYSVSQIVNGCESDRVSLTVTIKPQPLQPTVSSTQLFICQNLTNPPALTATPVNGGILNWYGTNASGSSSTIPSIPVTTVSGPFTYFVSQSLNGCEGPQASIFVFVQPTPPVPTVGPAPTYCVGGAPTTLSATPSPGGTLKWYTSETGGTASPTPPPLPTSAATITYFVSQSVNGCEGPRAALTATIRAAPSPPIASPTFTFCQNTPATPLTASANGTLNWYNSPTATSTVVPLPTTTSATTTFYYVSQTDANGCESTRTEVKAIVNAQPNAPTTTNLNICQGTASPPPLTLSVGATGTLTWYRDQTGGTPSPVAFIPPTNNDGAQLYYVSQKDAVTGCESPRSLLLVNIIPTPPAPVAPVLAPVCQSPTPVALTVAGQGLKWYADATSTTPVSQGPSINQSAAQVGQFTYYVSQTVSSCEGPRVPVQVVVNAIPPAPTVTPILSSCQDAQAQPLTAVGTALQWYDQNDNQISPQAPSTQIEATRTYTYKVTQTVNGCTSAKATLTYTINVTAPPAVVPSAEFCQNGPPRPLTASGTNLKWYDPSGAVTTVAPSPSTGAVTTGTSYFVTQTALGCESRKAEIKVTVNPQATATLTGSTSISQGSPATLTLTGTGSYTYVLSDRTTGMVVSTSPTGTTVQPIVVTPGATTSYTVQISNACGAGIASGSALVTVYVPTIATGALSTTSICSNSSLRVDFTNTGEFAPGNVFTAEIAPVTGTPTASSYIPLPTVLLPPTSGSPLKTLDVQIPTSIAAGQYVLRISASNATYPITGTPSSMTLTVRSLPVASLSANTTSIDRVTGSPLKPAVLSFSLVGEKPWSVTYTANSRQVIIPSISTSPYSLTVTPDSTTIYRLVSVLSNNGCGLGKIDGPDSATITVSLVTATEPDPFTNTVKVYPVPTDRAVTVDIDLPLPQPAQLRLTNLDGQTTQQFTTRQRQTTLYLDKEPGGVYLLYIKIGDKWTVRRILKW